MRVFLIVVLGFSLGACQLIYKLPTRQGNVIEQKQLDQLALGMTKDQVKFLLGTPIAASPFRDDRWDYLGYYKSPRGQASSRTVSLYFTDGKLSQMEGIKLAEAGQGQQQTDAARALDADKKDGMVADLPSPSGQPEASKVPNP